MATQTREKDRAGDGSSERSTPTGYGGLTGRLRRHSSVLALVALAIAIAVSFVIAHAAGFDAVTDTLGRIHPAWLIIVAGAQVVGVVGYAVAYRAVARIEDGLKLKLPMALRLVAAGFGAFTVGGGFLLDYHAWREAGDSAQGARIRVLGLGAVEYAVLAPAACVAAIVLLAGGSKAQPSLLWPWALAVPIGSALAFFAVRHRERLAQGKRGRRRRIDEALGAIYVLRRLVTAPLLGLGATLGMAVYWAAEIASLWAALKLFQGDVPIAGMIVAYATGYAATRRTLPLGGAGTTEALMTYSLTWVGLALPSALLAVVAYRLFNFGLITFPALRARASIDPLFSRKRLERSDDGDLRRLAAE